jgi:hypothetical protein
VTLFFDYGRAVCPQVGSFAAQHIKEAAKKASKFFGKAMPTRCTEVTTFRSVADNWRASAPSAPAFGMRGHVRALRARRVTALQIYGSVDLMFDFTIGTSVALMLPLAFTSE